MKYFKLDLQMFATDESAKEQEVADPVNENDSDSDNEEIDFDSNEIESNEGIEDEKDEVEENIEKQEATNPETQRDKELDSKIAAARRESEAKLQIMKNKQDSFAKTHGYNSFDEMQDILSQQKYEEQGASEELAKKMVQNDKMFEIMQEQTLKARISEEKTKLQGQKYFKDLESDIDNLIQQNPNLSVETAFIYLKGEKLEELTSNAGKVAAQKALNNINGKSHIKGDSNGVDIDTTSIDEDEFKFYKRLCPKGTRTEYAKFIKSQKGG